MTGLSHAAAGITAGLILSEKINADPLISAGLCVLGSLIVDIDSEESLINRLLMPTLSKNNRLSYISNYFTKNNNLVKIVIGACMQLASNSLLQYVGVILILSSICNKMEVRFSLFGGVQVNRYHRTIFHDPVLGTILLAAPLFLYNLQSFYIIPYMVGIALHYIMDSLTHAGLYSIVLRKFFRMPIHFNSSNKIAELVLISGCIAYLVYSKIIFNIL